jgi:monofunctional biosynthetic peptidoglycan transglycosylase
VKRRRNCRLCGILRVAGLVLLSILLVLVLVVLPFRWIPPPTTAFMQQAKLFGLGGAQPCRRIDWRWVDQEQISPYMTLAVIAAEDQRFMQHHGIDLDAISSVVREHQANGRLRGGSTLTQQLVKNLYLWPGQSWLRKGIEAGLAVVMELTWSKQRILEVYVNVVQFGACTFGVQAASQRFFATSARHLSATQAARLAASLPNPVRLRVDNHSNYLDERVRWIRQQMRQLGGTGYLRQL